MITVFGTQFKVYGWPSWLSFTGALPSDGTDLTDAWLAIRTRFNAQWTGTQPIQYPNQNFTPPANSTWLRLELTMADSRNASLGAAHVRHTGVIWIGVYIPKGTGIAAGIALAKTAATIFSNQRFSGVHCWAASIRDAGQFAGWRQITAVIPCWFDSY